MKYTFVTALHYMSLDAVFAKGKRAGAARISNSTDMLRDLLDKPYFRQYAGDYHCRELDGRVYFYETGDFEELKAKFDRDYNLSDYAFYLLRNAQYFADALWLVKDNSVYVRDGFLLLYEEGASDPEHVQFASLSRINSKTSGEVMDTTFSREELEQAINYYEPAKGFEGVEDGGKFPLKNPLEKKMRRVGRAHYFCYSARAASSLPLKILNYCTALECLLTVGNSELTHKVSERLAYLVGKDGEERKKYFQLAKDAYKIRSQAVHGQAVNTSEEEMKRIAKEIDDVFRLIFVNYMKDPKKYEVFGMKDTKDYEQWFTDLIFS